MREVYLRLVPLVRGGIPFNKEWREPSRPVALNDAAADGDTATRYVWPSDALIAIDDTRTGLHVLRAILNGRAGLTHLRALADTDIQNLVLFYDMDDGECLSNSLLRSDDFQKRIQLSRPYIKYGYHGDAAIAFPKRLVVLYPMRVEQKLLLPVVYEKSRKPLIWLDVDGVIDINGQDASLTDVQSLPQCYGNFLVDWGVRFSPQVVTELNRLATKCDIYWMTSWRDSARYRLAPAIGLDDFAVWPGAKGSYQFCDDFTRPLIWIDDHLDTADAFDPSICDDCIASVRRQFEKLLLVPARVEHGYGLAIKHIEQINAFINQCTV